MQNIFNFFLSLFFRAEGCEGHQKVAELLFSFTKKPKTCRRVNLTGVQRSGVQVHLYE